MSCYECKSSWANIALCADTTWVPGPPDHFILANQRLWSQHRRIQQLQNILLEKLYTPSMNNQSLQTNSTIDNSKATTSNHSAETRRRSVRDVIPESRLARFYGNFYYDDEREKNYTPIDDFSYSTCSCSGQHAANPTECWMLPEVEYWFRKLTESSEGYYHNKGLDPIALYKPAVNEAEIALIERVRAVRGLWSTCNASPPAPTTTSRVSSSPISSRKIRARRRRRQPRPRILQSPPPRFCPEEPAPLICDTNIKIDFNLAPFKPAQNKSTASHGSLEGGLSKTGDVNEATVVVNSNKPANNEDSTSPRTKNTDSTSYKDVTVVDKIQQTSEPTAKTSSQLESSNPHKRRLYSTVLSTMPSSVAKVVPNASRQRLARKVIPIRLGADGKPKPTFVPNCRMKQANSERRFEELEKEALEQYKASDESIDRKFSDLEKQALEQYSSSTSCSSGNSANRGKATASAHSINRPHDDKKTRKKFSDDQTLDSVVIYSQNFTSMAKKPMSLCKGDQKNVLIPPRGEVEETNKCSRGAKQANKDETVKKYNLFQWQLDTLSPKRRSASSSVSNSGENHECGELVAVIVPQAGGDLHPNPTSLR